MPRVTKDRLTDRKNCILTCTGKILKEKPLYPVVMRNITKKADFSQGIIYHYYRSIDEIFVEYINKNMTYHLLERNIDLLLQSEGTETEVLSGCIIVIGRYVEELLKSASGKTRFELTVFYTYDVEEGAVTFPRLKFRQSLVYMQNKISEFVLNHIEKGIFYPQIPVQSMILLINSSVSGVAQNMAIGSAQEKDISTMFQTLAKTMIEFLEAKHGTDERRR